MLLSIFLHQLTDITFLVGDTREPVCAVRAVLAARSLSDADGNGNDNNWKFELNKMVLPLNGKVDNGVKGE